MSSQKFPRKKYETPLHPWKESRIKSERELIKKYGLKNHKEVWKAKTYLGKHREQARELLAKVGSTNPQVKKESDQLLLHLTRMGILSMGASLDDVLALEIESVLSRRLQTLVYLKGFSSTPYQARQLICHGHVAVGNKKVTIPSYMVAKNEESQISYTLQSPLNELSHPARPKGDTYKTAEMGAAVNPFGTDKPVMVVPTKQQQTSTPVTPESKPATVVEVAKQPTPAITEKLPEEKPPEEKPPEEKPTEEKPAGKPKEQSKKEKKTEGA
ncbi:MAG: 30S ribosomal protein S4 [Thermoplasmata archaeon M11B2D]|nr:MAG: 30S ribosomal protein S4 [Thermoplasmata archaeon M11B2D]PNX53393.1 MAG: 30S ribosomal protein S4 [Thermoplasmata archaeon M9B2D]